MTRLLDDGSVDTSYGTNGWQFVEQFKFNGSDKSTGLLDAKLTATDSLVLMYGAGAAPESCNAKQFSVLDKDGAFDRASVGAGQVQTVQWSLNNVAALLACSKVRRFELENDKIIFAQGTAAGSANIIVDVFQVKLMGDDAVPDQFTFSDVINAPLNVELASAVLTVKGIDRPAEISVQNGEYSINSKAYTSVPGLIYPGDSVSVRHVTASANKTRVDTTLTIGGVSDTFSSTTRPKTWWELFLDWLRKIFSIKS